MPRKVFFTAANQTLSTDRLLKVFQIEGLTPTQKLVLCIFLCFADEKGIVTCLSHERIGDFLCICKAAIARAMRGLIAQGLVSFTLSGEQNRRYKVKV